MKKLLTPFAVLFAALFVFAGCTNGASEQEETPEETKIVPKSVKYTYYNTDGTVYYYEILEFNEDGTNKSYKHYDADGTLSTSYNYRSYESDGNGNYTKESYYAYNSETETFELSNYYTFDYNENGKLVKKTDHYPEGNTSDYYIFQYDENNNCIREDHYYFSGKPYSYGSHSYERDENGFITKEICYDEDGYISYVAEYENDSEGNPIKRTLYNSNGVKYLWYIIEPANNGAYYNGTDKEYGDELYYYPFVFVHYYDLEFYCTKWGDYKEGQAKTTYTKNDKDDITEAKITVINDDNSDGVYDASESTTEYKWTFEYEYYE